MSYFHENDDEDLRAEVAAERRASAHWRHWCDVCHGHTGPGSPCAPEPEEAPEEEASPFCECNAEPTVSELEDGQCDACGKELS